MRRLPALLLFGASLIFAAQTRLTVQQLLTFVRSSLELKQDDREVAQYLRKVKLTQKLDDHTIEDLQGQGIGPKTLEALNQLKEESKDLPAAAPVPPPPVKPAVVIPPPSQEEQGRIIDQARDYALSYTKRLPDFMCTQVTRRYYDPTGMEFWQKEDTITIRLSYFEQKENYKVILVNNHVADTSIDALGGATSTGEFGTMLKELFEPDTRAEFGWERWATLRGRRTYVFNYRVAQNHSKWHVNYQRRVEVVPGYHGLVYVDKETGAVVRVTLEAELPPSFPLQAAGTMLDYDFTDISGQQFLLPLRAQMRMREGKFLLKNDVEFRLYRKFSADATISFDTPEELPDEKLKEQAPK